jgi:hypothetical protein
MYENLGGGILRRTRVGPAIRVCLTLAIVACNGPRPASHDSAGKHEKAADLGTALANVSTIPLRAPRALSENSSASMSVRQPGVFFSINDSGNDALLFGLDTTGADRGNWRVVGASNVDWEATAIGPCGTASCVYIGDTGDNDAMHQSRTIYRVVEPDALPPGSHPKLGQLSAQSLQFRYQDSPHDVEAMYVPPNGDVVLITKRPMIVRLGHYRQALVFRLPSLLWGSSGRAVATLVDSLPIVPGSAPFRLITDAALSPDAKHLAVRTYAQVYIFATDSLTGAIDHGVSPSVCDVTTLSEYQGEGVSWVNNTGRLVFTSEGKRAPLHIADCPLPSG